MSVCMCCIISLSYISTISLLIAVSRRRHGTAYGMGYTTATAAVAHALCRSKPPSRRFLPSFLPLFIHSVIRSFGHSVIRSFGQLVRAAATRLDFRTGVVSAHRAEQVLVSTATPPAPTSAIA